MVEQRSWKYMFYLIVFMGLVGQMDVWLSLIETTAVPALLAYWPSLTLFDFGIYQGIFGVIVFLVFFIGWFSDAYGRRKGILLLMFVMGIPALLIGLFSISFFVFMLLYSITIMGTTSNLWEVPLAEEAPPKRRGLYGALAFLISVIPLSSIIGVDIVNTFGFQWGYGVMFLLMLFLLILLVFMKEPDRWVEARAKREKSLGILEALKSLGRKDVSYAAVATIVYLTWTISFKIGTTWGGYFFITVLGVDPVTEWKLILTVAGLMLPVSAIISGVLLDKIGRNFTMILGTLGSVISFILLGLTFSAVFYWGVYFFMSMLLAWIYVYLAEIFPTPVRSTSIGIAVTGSRLGYVIGPLIAAVFISNFQILWIVAGIVIILPLLSLLTKPYETKGKTLEEIEDAR